MSSGAEEKVEDKKDGYGRLILFLVVVIVVWLSSFSLMEGWFPRLQDRGMFGDSFGVANSLFSALAFAGIIYTITLQRKELRLQRLELKETREELKRSADAQEKSERQLRRQSENLKISAKLSALNTLANFYGQEVVKFKHHNATARKAAEKLQNEYIMQIKEILDRKNA